MESPVPTTQRPDVAELLAQISEYCDDLDVFLNDEVAVLEDMARRAADHCRATLASAEEASQRQLEEEARRRQSIEDDLAACQLNLEELQNQSGEIDAAHREQQSAWEEQLEALRAELHEARDDSQRVQQLERDVAQAQDQLAQAKSQLREQVGQFDDANNQVSDAQQQISDLQVEVEHLQSELKITKSRLSEEKRRAVEDRADAAAELKLLRRALEVRSSDAESSGQAGAPVDNGLDEGESPPLEDEIADHSAEPSEPADPVLDAVMAQFQKLQSSAAEATGR